MKRVLIIEDDKDIVETGAVTTLQMKDFRSNAAFDGSSGPEFC